MYSTLVGRKVIFAAIYPEVAVAMSGHWMDKDLGFGRTIRGDQDPESVPYTLREKREDAFSDFLSDPISLYEVNGKYFRADSDIQDFEVVSDKPAKIVEEHRIEDPLDYIKNSRMVVLKWFKSS